MRTEAQWDRRYNTEARVLLALVYVYERDGRATVRKTAEVTGYSLDTVSRHLHDLADLGLVDCGTPGSKGTLRPLVERVR